MRERTVLQLGRLRLSLVWPEKPVPSVPPVIAGKLTSEENEAAYEAACIVIRAGGSPDAAVKAGDHAVLALRKTKAEGGT